MRSTALLVAGALAALSALVAPARAEIKIQDCKPTSANGTLEPLLDYQMQVTCKVQLPDQTWVGKNASVHIHQPYPNSYYLEEFQMWLSQQWLLERTWKGYCASNPWIPTDQWGTMPTFGPGAGVERVYQTGNQSYKWGEPGYPEQFDFHDVNAPIMKDLVGYMKPMAPHVVSPRAGEVISPYGDSPDHPNGLTLDIRSGGLDLPEWQREVMFEWRRWGEVQPKGALPIAYFVRPEQGPPDIDVVSFDHLPQGSWLLKVSYAHVEGAEDTWVGFTIGEPTNGQTQGVELVKPAANDVVTTPGILPNNFQIVFRATRQFEGGSAGQQKGAAPSASASASQTASQAQAANAALTNTELPTIEFEIDEKDAQQGWVHVPLTWEAPTNTDLVRQLPGGYYRARARLKRSPSLGEKPGLPGNSWTEWHAFWAGQPLVDPSKMKAHSFVRPGSGPTYTGKVPSAPFPGTGSKLEGSGRMPRPGELFPGQQVDPTKAKVHLPRPSGETSEGQIQAPVPTKSKLPQETKPQIDPEAATKTRLPRP